jgi:beta-lactamase superfamily II metal-dependent hydrolase
VKPNRSGRVLLFVGLVLLATAGRVSAQLFSGRPDRPARPVIVDFLDVGQGDSVLIRSPEGKTALIDAGPTRDGALNQLKRKGIDSIDIVILSHHHSDHYMGMEQVILACRPKYFMATGSAHTTRTYLKLLQTVKSEGITYVQPTGKPRKIELGAVDLTVFPQPPEADDEENNNSIGIRLQYGDFSVLLTGDSENEERRWWLSHCPDLVRGCTILKLAHHGSRNGTDQRWLDRVEPELAVASLGAGNSFGHPHSQTVSLLRRNQIPLLRTDQRGTITVTSNGRTWNLVDPGLAGRRGSRSEDAVATSTRDDVPASRPSRSRSVRR